MIPLSKRLVAIAFAAAALALPAAPAHADHCIGWATTPVQCAEHALQQVADVPSCVYVGTFEIVCLPAVG